MAEINSDMDRCNMTLNNLTALVNNIELCEINTNIGNQMERFLVSEYELRKCVQGPEMWEI